jgi:integrating conjugative element protein (TIGR03757 family)
VRVRTLAAALSAIVMQQTALAEGTALRVEVFTLSTLPLANARGATVYYVDSVVLLEQQLSANLPSDPRQAQAIATQRVAVLGPQLRAGVGAGAAGLARAAQLGVDRAPAVVFDGRWVVYGMTDVNTARRIFDAKAKHFGTMR